VQSDIRVIVCLQASESTVKWECAILLNVPVRIYSIFVHYVISSAIFEKKSIIKQKIYILIFFTTFV
jgi:hypothetical protein